MQTLITKGRAVPTCVVNGEVFSTFEVPNAEKLEAKVREILLASGAR
jgi:hypothetical protein